MYYRGSYDEPYYRNLVSTLETIYFDMQRAIYDGDKLKNIFINASSDCYMFSADNILGTYSDEARMNKIQNVGETYPPYFPALVKKV